MNDRYRIVSIGVVFALLSVACQADPAPSPAKKSAAVSQTSTAKQKVENHPALFNASLAKDKAPASFKVAFSTTKGEFTVEAQRAWSPNGVDRFYNLVQIGFFDDVAFFRAIKGFMVQFGIHGNPDVSRAWARAQIKDDEPGQQSNTRAMLTFAKTGRPNSRATQLFVNYGDNARLDKMGFTPIAKVIDGMDVVDSLYSGYGAALGRQQDAITTKGNAFLREKYPEVDYIKTAKLLP